MNTLKICLAQLNKIVGDIEGNYDKIVDAYKKAHAATCDIIIFPELFIIGYPVEDLVLHPSLMNQVREKIRDLRALTLHNETALLISTPWIENRCLYNATILIEKGEVKAVRYKHHLPNEGVFDEKRTFSEGPLPQPILFKNVKLGCMICEDMWHSDVAGSLARENAEILIVQNASPFDIDKQEKRLRLALNRVKETQLPLLYVNTMGGQDELVFDGGSFVMNKDGNVAFTPKKWSEELIVTDWIKDDNGWKCLPVSTLTHVFTPYEDIYQALLRGLKDYVQKSGFKKIVLGLSGGIDSALTAVIAVDALGEENVRCVRLPSRYTSKESMDDAEELAKNLNCTLDTVEIATSVDAIEKTLSPLFAGKRADITEENIQARTRGILLMAISNKFGELLITTGNKSEFAVGYTTLYGDMCGAFAVLKDVYKTTVYRLSEWRNTHVPYGIEGKSGKVIPENTIKKAPTAELRPDQTDQDSLPPYDILDDILEGLIERKLPTKILGHDYSKEDIEKIESMLFLSEFKRRQSPPGTKITSRNLGRDRRYPIINKFIKHHK